MKKNIILLIFIAFTFNLKAQNANGFINNINTNPDNSLNNQVISKTNTFFDWRTEFFNHYKSGTSCTIDRIISPFFSSSSGVLYETKDMNPDDGWELILQQFVKPYDYYLTKSLWNDYVQYPILILYNKYNSTLRIMSNINDPYSSNYQFYKVKIRLSSSETFTSILDLSFNDHNTTNIAISEFQNRISKFSVDSSDFSSVKEYLSQPCTWMYADFPMSYDPCTCLFSSTIEIRVDLISSIF